MNLTEAEDIKKTWQEYTEELYKKNLHNPDSHDGVITHLESDRTAHAHTHTCTHFLIDSKTVAKSSGP